MELGDPPRRYALDPAAGEPPVLQRVGPNSGPSQTRSGTGLPGRGEPRGRTVDPQAVCEARLSPATTALAARVAEWRRKRRYREASWALVIVEAHRQAADQLSRPCGLEMGFGFGLIRHGRRISRDEANRRWRNVCRPVGPGLELGFGGGVDGQRAGDLQFRVLYTSSILPAKGAGGPREGARRLRGRPPQGQGPDVLRAAGSGDSADQPGPEDGRFARHRPRDARHEHAQLRRSGSTRAASRS